MALYPRLVVVNGKESGRIFPLPFACTVLGRSNKVGIPLRETGISRHHARFMVDRGKVKLEDLKSTNGSYLNGRRINSGRLKDGDTLQFGACRLVFRSDRPSPKKGKPPSSSEDRQEHSSPDRCRDPLPPQSQIPKGAIQTMEGAGETVAAVRCRNRRTSASPRNSLPKNRRPPPMKPGKRNLNHESLDSYQAALEFLSLSSKLSQKLPKGYSSLIDQFRRASLSIPLNIAEGYGKRGPRDQARFYDIARGSAHECGALLDSVEVLGLVSESTYEKGKELLHRIVSMLVKMARC